MQSLFNAFQRSYTPVLVQVQLQTRDQLFTWVDRQLNGTLSCQQSLFCVNLIVINTVFPFWCDVMMYFDEKDVHNGTQDSSNKAADDWYPGPVITDSMRKIDSNQFSKESHTLSIYIICFYEPARITTNILFQTFKPTKLQIEIENSHIRVKTTQK